MKTHTVHWLSSNETATLRHTYLVITYGAKQSIKVPMKVLIFLVARWRRLFCSSRHLSLTLCGIWHREESKLTFHSILQVYNHILGILVGPVENQFCLLFSWNQGLLRGSVSRFHPYCLLLLFSYWKNKIRNQISIFYTNTNHGCIKWTW